MSLAALGLGLAVWAWLIAVFSLMRPVENKHVLTLQVSLSLLRDDDGSELLVSNASRSETWWEDADPHERRLIDRTLSMWDLAAWYVAAGKIDPEPIMAVFAGRIVDLWERAYPYVEHCREEQPSSWSSLAEIYLDAYDVDSRPLVRELLPADSQTARSVSPEDAPPEPFVEATPPLVVPPVVPPETQAAAPPRATVNLLPPELRRRRTSDRVKVIPDVDGTAPVPQPATRSSPTRHEHTGLGWAPVESTTSERSEEVSAAEPADPWAAALRKAGAVSSPSPFAGSPGTLAHMAALLTGAEAIDQDRLSEPSPRRSPTTTPKRPSQAGQVIDLDRAMQSARRDVLG